MLLSCVSLPLVAALLLHPPGSKVERIDTGIRFPAAATTTRPSRALAAPPPSHAPAADVDASAPRGGGGGVRGSASASLSKPLPLADHHTSAPDAKLVGSGEYLIGAPNVFRGVTASGNVAEVRPLLPHEEQMELIQRAWFYLLSVDARRNLADARTAQEEAEGEAFPPPNHLQVLAAMHAAQRAAALRAGGGGRGVSTADAIGALPAARGGGGGGGGGGGPDGRRREIGEFLSLKLPVTLGDTEFRLKESSGRAAYNKLFLHNQGLIYSEVNKLISDWNTYSVIEKADLLQEGAQGLLRAIRLFDLNKGVRLSTYAVWHIRAYVLRSIRDKGRLVRLPQQLQQDMLQIRKARYRYAVDNLGHAPGIEALADLLHWEPARVESALKGLRGSETTSLDADEWRRGDAAGSGGSGSLLHKMASSQHGSAHAEKMVYRQQLHLTLRQALRERDPRRAKMTLLKYGLEDGREWTYPELAARYNISKDSAKTIVRSEVAFLRREKRRVLEPFMGHS